MKKLIRISAALVALLFSVAVFAHGEHEHNNFDTVSMTEAKGIAGQEIDRLIKEGKIDKVWASKPLDAAMERVNNQRQWVVTSKAGQGGKALQLFLSTEGYLLSYDIVDL